MSVVSENWRASTTAKAPESTGRRNKRGWAFAILAALALAAALDGFFIEPYWIQVIHYDIEGPVAAPLKIADLSDLHTHGLGRRERRLLDELAAEKPDMIVITGDSIGVSDGNYAQARQVYERLHAPLGVWFVRGNWEDNAPLHDEGAYYQRAGIRLLVNQNAEPRPDIAVIGLDDPYTGTANLKAALEGVPSSAYKIALFHSPAYFDKVAGRVNLVLSGHTHGGQVRLPFLTPLWLPLGSGRFLEGWYEERGSKMYVNRGLGTSILPVRFFCRPEITFITVRPAE